MVYCLRVYCALNTTRRSIKKIQCMNEDNKEVNFHLLNGCRIRWFFTHFFSCILQINNVLFIFFTDFTFKFTLKFGEQWWIKRGKKSVVNSEEKNIPKSPYNNHQSVWLMWNIYNHNMYIVHTTIRGCCWCWCCS